MIGHTGWLPSPDALLIEQAKSYISGNWHTEAQTTLLLSIAESLEQIEALIRSRV